MFILGSWKFWLVVIFIGFIIIWFIAGSKDVKYIGLKPFYDKLRLSDNNKNDNKNEKNDQDIDNNKDIANDPPEAPKDEEYKPKKKHYQPPSETESDGLHASKMIFKAPDRNKWMLSIEDPIPLLTSSEETCQGGKLKSPYPIKNMVVSPKKDKAPITRPPAIDITPDIPYEVMCAAHYYPQPSEKKIKSHRSRAEACCAQILEDIYDKPFISVRPQFLKNPETGANVEIDCYNEELQIGLEYQGEHHYHYPPSDPRIRKTMTYEKFIKQVRRDRYKVDACDVAGVYLITVPHNVPEPLYKAYIEYYLPDNVARRCGMILETDV